MLDFFVVTVAVVQIAGGLLEASLAWKFLNESDAARKKPPKSDPAATTTQASAFYPPTLALTVGPGAISMAITIGASFPSTVQPFIADAISAVIGAFVACVTPYLCLRYSERSTQMLGASRTAVVPRLSAFILLCIGVQTMRNGANALFGFTRALHPAAP